MKKSFVKIPSARLQRMKLSLIKYDINLIYFPGKQLYIADFLSRYFDKENSTVEIEDLNEFIHTVNVTPERCESFKMELRNDDGLMKLRQVLLEGWPKDRTALSEDVRFYWKHRNDLYIEDGLIFFNDRIIVPTNLRPQILSQLHASHLGIEKTKKRARGLVYWPRIDEDIEYMITKCAVCQNNRSANVKEMLISHEVPHLPFSKLGMDICEYASKAYLIVGDYYSRFLEIIPLKSKTASECIEKLKPCFATHGLPLEIISDNMPFNSQQFKNFCIKIGVKLTTTSPGYAQSNGFAEKSVGIAKNLIKKSHQSQEELWLALLEYRNTPLKEVDAAPVELLMSRKTRSLIPARTALYKPCVIPKINGNINKKNFKAKQYYDRNAKFKLPFGEGEKIWYRHNQRGWIKAIVRSADGAPRSYWIELEDGAVYRRNSKWLRKRVD